MKPLTLRTDAFNQRSVAAPQDFQACTVSELRQLGIVFSYTCNDGSKIALSFENENGCYVVWSLYDGGHGYYTFKNRLQAITHAVRIASIVYTD